MNSALPWSRLLLAAGCLGGFGAGVVFHRTFWLEPSLPLTASTSPSTIKSEPGEAEPVAATEGTPVVVPVSDPSPHPEVVAEIVQTTGNARFDRSRMEALADRLGVADFPGILEQPEVQWDPELKSALVSRWAELNPLAAATFLFERRLDPRWSPRGFLGDVVKNWLMRPSQNGAGTDSREEVLTWIKGLPDFWQGQLLLEALTQLVDLDLEAAVALYTKQQNEWQLQAHSPSEFLEKLAAQDPHRALDLASRLPPSWRYITIQQIVSRWVTQAPQSALSWLRQYPHPPALMVSEMFYSWAQYRLDEAMDAVAQLPPGSVRDHAQQAIASALVRTDPARAKTWLETLPAGPSRTILAKSIADRLTENNPALAAEVAATMPVSNHRTEQLRLALYEWATHDPHTAAAMLLRAFPPGHARESAMDTLAPWARRAPAEALDWMLREGPHVTEALESIIDEGARYQPAATLEWIKAQPASPQRTEWFAKFVSELSDGAPQLAAEHLSQWPPGDNLQRATQKVARAWANADPAPAAQWAERLTSPAQRLAAYQAIAQSWTQKDQPAAAAWLQQLPAGAERDAAVEQFARQIPTRAGELAAQWGESIVDEKRRQATLDFVLNRWKQQDAAAVAKYLNFANSTLPPAEQAALRKKFSQP